MVSVFGASPIGYQCLVHGSPTWSPPESNLCIRNFCRVLTYLPLKVQDQTKSCRWELYIKSYKKTLVLSQSGPITTYKEKDSLLKTDKVWSWVFHFPGHWSPNNHILQSSHFVKGMFKGIVGCPLPTYPYGKSLYKPYIVGIYGL